MSVDLPPVVGSRYKVLRELGRGGMGAVYLVEHAHTGEQLALKVLLSQVGADADMVERFKREARAPAKIKSEHVVRVTDADVAPELGGAPFLVMEALDGADLDKLVQQRGPLPPAEVVWILRQVASALDKAHAMGIVHRDLKPENLFLHKRDDGSSIIKILDFGISKVMGTAGNAIEGAGLTKTGAMMGTPLYMAPEQARGLASNIGPATDIWAIGLIAVNLLTANVYWTAETVTELLLKIVVEPMPPPSVRFPMLGTRLDAWFSHSCDREPNNRFRSVGEQVASLAQALGVELGAATTNASVVSLGASQATSVAQSGAFAQPGASTESVMARSMGTAGTPSPRSGAGMAIALGALGLVLVLGGGAFLWMRSGSSSAAASASAEAVATAPAAIPTPAAAAVEPPPPTVVDSAPAQTASVASVTPRAPTAAPAVVAASRPKPTAKPAAPAASPKPAAGAPKAFAPLAP